MLENPAQGGGYSNVYSFGVIIWELVTRTVKALRCCRLDVALLTNLYRHMLVSNRAQYPYGTKEFTDKLAESIMRGFRPSIPDSMPPGFRGRTAHLSLLAAYSVKLKDHSHLSSHQRGVASRPEETTVAV
mgnify:CR=1 FL=1